MIAKISTKGAAIASLEACFHAIVQGNNVDKQVLKTIEALVRHRDNVVMDIDK